MENPEQRRLKDSSKEVKSKVEEEVKHEENEWGITMGEEEVKGDVLVVTQQKPEYVEVKKEQSLAELMSSMKKLQTK